MVALAARHEDITRVMEFEHAQLNFTTAARQGLGATFTWLEGEELGAPALVLDRLLPLAHDGLDLAGISTRDRDRLLGVIEERTRSGNTGSRWLLRSLQAMKDAGTQGERLHALTAATCARQKEGQPVAKWDLARLDEGGGWKHNYLKVEQFMTTELTTVHEDDPVDLVANLMEWSRTRHVPVEDNNHRFVVLRLYTRGEMGRGSQSVAVSDIMKREVYTVAPDAPTGEAIALMRKHQIGCLPVVLDGRLVGVVTERDYMAIAGELLEQKLRE
jgi:CBS domain-containing protein